MRQSGANPGQAMSSSRGGRPRFKAAIADSDWFIEFLGLVFLRHPKVWEDLNHLSRHAFFELYPQLKWVRPTIDPKGRSELKRRKRPEDWLVLRATPMEVKMPPWYFGEDADQFLTTKPAWGEFKRKQHAFLDARLSDYSKLLARKVETEKRIWVAYAYWFLEKIPAEIAKDAQNALGKGAALDRSTLGRWLEEFSRLKNGPKMRPPGTHQAAVRAKGVAASAAKRKSQGGSSNPKPRGY